MAHDIVFDVDFDKYGFLAAEDTTSVPRGSLRVMRNAIVTERGGLAPRPGTVLIGEKEVVRKPIRGFYNFRKSIGSDEILIKAFDDSIKYLSKKYESSGWTELRDNFTPDQEFGFAHSLVNNENEDYLIGCNRYEPYFSWTGAIAKMTSARVGAETTVVVDSAFLPDIYEAGTPSSDTATTIVISPAKWAADQWVGFYVHITTGTYAGFTRKITANTADTLTFDALPGDPSNSPFEIRKPAFPDTGSLRYNGAIVAYSAINKITEFTVANAAAAPIDTLVTANTTDYPEAPRGNRIANYMARIVVGNVRSALVKDSGGADIGYASAGSVFVSQLYDPFDFSYAATRVAGEGDVIAMPYGGGDITDVQYHEDTAYVFKGEYIEAISYSQDTSDFAVRNPLKEGIGSVGKTIKGADDIYFVTPDKQLTTIGRVSTKDIRPQTLNIGSNIERFLNRCGVDDVGRGLEINRYVYFPLKSSEAATYNDILLVWNRDSKTFEGIWDIGAFGIQRWNGKYVYAESGGPDVYEMFVGHSDVIGANRFPIDFEVVTHRMNLTASKAYQQAMNGIYLEGYIAGGAQFTTNIWGGFDEVPFLTFTFSFTEEGLLDGQLSTAFLGSKPLGIDPMAATIGDPDEQGRRHFSFRQYFPWQYYEYFSLGLAASVPDNDFELIRAGLILRESPSYNMRRVRSGG